MAMDERCEFLRQSIESRDRQIGELTDKLVRVTNEDATAIRTLARIAEARQ